MNTIAEKNSQDSHISTGATPTPPDKALTRLPHRYRKWLLLAGTMAALAVGAYFLVPWVHTALSTVSTDDAYVNGHVTLVAPRVPGQVMKVLVDDNQRVKKGDLLVQLDKEPFQVLVSLKRAAVRVAEANLAAAESGARGLGAQLGAQRWKLQNASEQVDEEMALFAFRLPFQAAPSLPKVVAAGRNRGRAGGGRLLPGPVGQYGTQHGEYR